MKLKKSVNGDLYKIGYADQDCYWQKDLYKWKYVLAESIHDAIKIAEDAIENEPGYENIIMSVDEVSSGSRVIIDMGCIDE